MSYTQLASCDYTDADDYNSSLARMNSSYSKGDAAAGDPFYKVRDNVNAQVERIRLKNDKFQDLLRNCDTAKNAEFKDLRKVLLRDLKAAEKDVKGLTVAIEMIEKNR